MQQSDLTLGLEDLISKLRLFKSPTQKTKITETLYYLSESSKERALSGLRDRIKATPSINN